MAGFRCLSLLRDLFAQTGLQPDDIHWVVPHQASGPALTMLPRLGFAKAKVIDIIENYGNCVAASMPMALAHANAAGKIQRGERVLLLGTGAGLSVAGAILRW